MCEHIDAGAGFKGNPVEFMPVDVEKTEICYCNQRNFDISEFYLERIRTVGTAFCAFLDIFHLKLNVENVVEFKSDEGAAGETDFVESVVAVAVNLRGDAAEREAAVEGLGFSRNAEKSKDKS